MISEKEWKKLKTNESYGMYVDLHNKISENDKKIVQIEKNVEILFDSVSKLAEKMR